MIYVFLDPLTLEVDPTNWPLSAKSFHLSVSHSVCLSIRQCDDFWPFLQNDSKDFPNFCVSVEDIRAHCLSR